MDNTQVAEKQQEQRRRIRPRYQIHKDKGMVVVNMEMPGVEKGNVNIHIENGSLCVEGYRDNIAADGKYLVQERIQGDFYQSFTLDDTIDTNQIDAVLEKGILNITLHLKDEVKPRKIQIKSV